MANGQSNGTALTWAQLAALVAILGLVWNIQSRWGSDLKAFKMEMVDKDLFATEIRALREVMTQRVTSLERRVEDLHKAKDN